MSYLKTVETNTQVTVSEEGELLDIETKRKQVLVNTPDQYFTVYGKIIGALNDVSGAGIKLAIYLISNAPINQNFICITAPYRKQIAQAIGVSESYTKDLLKELTEKNILIKDDSSVRSSCYYINPEYYWKGDMQGRNSAMRFMLELKYTL